MSDRSITELIRLDCDGELDQDQARQLQRHLQEHPEDRKLVEVERRLRERVGIVMTAACPSAPADLAERIRHRLETDEAEVEAEPAGFSFAQWLQGPRRANVYAVAASLTTNQRGPGKRSRPPPRSPGSMLPPPPMAGAGPPR